MHFFCLQDECGKHYIHEGAEGDVFRFWPPAGSVTGSVVGWDFRSQWKKKRKDSIIFPGLHSNVTCARFQKRDQCLDCAKEAIHTTILFTNINLVIIIIIYYVCKHF